MRNRTRVHTGTSTLISTVPRSENLGPNRTLWAGEEQKVQPNKTNCLSKRLLPSTVTSQDPRQARTLIFTSHHNCGGTTLTKIAPSSVTAPAQMRSITMILVKISRRCSSNVGAASSILVVLEDCRLLVRLAGMHSAVTSQKTETSSCCSILMSGSTVRVTSARFSVKAKTAAQQLAVHPLGHSKPSRLRKTSLTTRMASMTSRWTASSTS